MPKFGAFFMIFNICTKCPNFGHFLQVHTYFGVTPIQSGQTRPKKKQHKIATKKRQHCHKQSPNISTKKRNNCHTKARSWKLRNVSGSVCPRDEIADSLRLFALFVRSTHENCTTSQALCTHVMKCADSLRLCAPPR